MRVARRGLVFAALLAAVGLDLYLVYRAECIPKRAARETARAGAAVPEAR